MSQLKCNPLHYAIATLTSATTFNQKKLVAKLLWLPFLGLLLHFFGVAVDRKSCSVNKALSSDSLEVEVCHNDLRSSSKKF